jgi:hypothetical protein
VYPSRFDASSRAGITSLTSLFTFAVTAFCAIGRAFSITGTLTAERLPVDHGFVGGMEQGFGAVEEALLVGGDHGDLARAVRLGRRTRHDHGWRY